MIVILFNLSNIDISMMKYKLFFDAKIYMKILYIIESLFIYLQGELQRQLYGKWKKMNM